MAEPLNMEADKQSILSRLLAIFAKLVSVLVHPLWWPTFGLYILLALNPYLFGTNTTAGKSTLILQVFMLTWVLPLLSIFLMRKLDMIKSMDLKNRLDRIGPYIITMIFYLWLYVNIRRDPQVPLVYTIFVFGALITLILVFIMNMFIKVSAHAAVMGGLIAMTWVTFNIFSHDHFSITWPWKNEADLLSWREVLMLVLFVAGLVGTCRVYLKAHSLKEVYIGYGIGLIAQWIAFKFLF